MKAYESTDYIPSVEAGTLLLKASTMKNFVGYTAQNQGTMKYPPYLSPNCVLYPVESLLREEYPLHDFNKLSKDLALALGFDCSDYILGLWTFAYYTGWSDFSSKDIFLSTDGVNFSLPPLFNYSGAFESPCEYESIKPPRRAFQCYWHYFSQNCELLLQQPTCLRQAIDHFTKQTFYR